MCLCLHVLTLCFVFPLIASTGTQHARKTCNCCVLDLPGCRHKLLELELRSNCCLKLLFFCCTYVWYYYYYYYYYNNNYYYYYYYHYYA